MARSLLIMRPKCMLAAIVALQLLATSTSSAVAATPLRVAGDRGDGIIPNRNNKASKAFQFMLTELQRDCQPLGSSNVLCQQEQVMTAAARVLTWLVEESGQTQDGDNLFSCDFFHHPVDEEELRIQISELDAAWKDIQDHARPLFVANNNKQDESPHGQQDDSLEAKLVHEQYQALRHFLPAKVQSWKSQRSEQTMRLLDHVVTLIHVSDHWENKSMWNNMATTDNNANEHQSPRNALSQLALGSMIQLATSLGYLQYERPVTNNNATCPGPLRFHSKTREGDSTTTIEENEMLELIRTVSSSTLQQDLWTFASKLPTTTTTSHDSSTRNQPVSTEEDVTDLAAVLQLVQLRYPQYLLLQDTTRQSARRKPKAVELLLHQHLPVWRTLEATVESMVVAGESNPHVFAKVQALQQQTLQVMAQTALLSGFVDPPSRTATATAATL